MTRLKAVKHGQNYVDFVERDKEIERDAKMSGFVPKYDRKEFWRKVNKTFDEERYKVEMKIPQGLVRW